MEILLSLELYGLARAQIEKILPIIKDHITAKFTKYEVLKQLYECSFALPFIFPFKLATERSPAMLYDEIIISAIKLILGWVLPAEGKPATISVYLHRITHHEHGTSDSRMLQSVLKLSKRFSRWSVKEVKWLDTSRVSSYVPYGDILAYLPLETTREMRVIGDKARYKDLPGYIPLSLDLIPRLERLEYIERNFNTADALDLFVELKDTKLLQMILEDFKKRFSANPVLQLKLFEELNNRYLSKDRDLDSLQVQFDAVRNIVPEPDIKIGSRIWLLWTLVHLQNANHDGNAERIAEITPLYEEVISELIDEDPELVSYAQLHLAVAFADRFEFDKAHSLLDEIFQGDRFNYLPRTMRAKLLSGLGQYKSMLGMYDEAESAFEMSLHEFKSSYEDSTILEGEISQTATYRALNAVDGGLPDAKKRLVEVLKSPGESERFFASPEGALANPYHHHLLLRTIVLSPETYLGGDIYLSGKKNWVMGKQDPWQHIACYRGILLWRSGNKTSAEKWLHRGISLAARSKHGPILKLIGAKIAAVGFSLSGEESFREQAGKLLEEASVLNAAEGVISSIRQYLQVSEQENANRILCVLPFYYH